MAKFFRKIKFWFFSFLFLFLSFSKALAEADITTNILINPLQVKTLTGLFEKIISFLAGVGAPLLAIAITIGGFMILTAGGSPEKVKKGKDTILWASVGYIVVLCAWGVIYIINEVLGVK